MSQAEWYKTGGDGYEKSKQLEEERAASYGPSRFWLKPGTSAKVTFLDTEGFYFHEHNLKINGKWGNFYTCLKDFNECPICESGDTSGYVCAYTIIDHSEYESQKSGKIFKNQKRLLVVRPAVMNKLARRRESLEGNLTHGLFLFSRDKKEECNTGEDIEFLKRLPVESILKFKPKEGNISDEDWLKPFDYMQLFAPKSVDELRKIVGQNPPVGADNYSAREATAAVVHGATKTDDASIDDLL